MWSAAKQERGAKTQSNPLRAAIKFIPHPHGLLMRGWRRRREGAPVDVTLAGNIYSTAAHRSVFELLHVSEQRRFFCDPGSSSLKFTFWRFINPVAKSVLVSSSLAARSRNSIRIRYGYAYAIWLNLALRIYRCSTVKLMLTHYVRKIKTRKHQLIKQAESIRPYRIAASVTLTHSHSLTDKTGKVKKVNKNRSSRLSTLSSATI